MILIVNIWTVLCAAWCIACILKIRSADRLYSSRLDAAMSFADIDAARAMFRRSAQFWMTMFVFTPAVMGLVMYVAWRLAL